MARAAARQPPPAILGRRVRARREEMGLSQEGLADLVGLHRTYIGSVERGERNVTLITIVRLAATLRVDPGELVHGIIP
ncbi:MAG: helix-turn-helix domain-containing protein [Acidimicrobiales bacterium]